MVHSIEYKVEEDVSNEQIKQLLTDRRVLKTQIDKIDNAINALRALCEHNMLCHGHGHNTDYYVCNKCGETKWA